MSSIVSLTAFVLVLSALTAQAAEPSAREVGERQRIASERAAVEAAYAERRRDCETRFAVTPCIEQARAARRESLGHLRRQESLLDEAQRKQRAAERMAAIRQKVSAEEARQREPVRSKAREAPMRVVAPRAGQAVPTPAAPASAASAARAAAEARSRARYEARQREAQKQREAAELRAAERAKAAKPPSAPLPPPR